MRLVPVPVTAALVTAALATAGLLGVPQAASAAPAPNVVITSSATGPTSGARTDTKAVVTVQVTVADDPVDDAVVTATVPGSVNADDVTFDGDPADPGTVTVTHKSDPERTEVKANVGFGATAVTGGQLVEGDTYPITVTTTLSPASETGRLLRASSTLTYDDAGDAGSETTTATIALPDLTLTRPKEIPGGTPAASDGSLVVVFAEVGLRGRAVSASTLDITTPTGLQFISDQVLRFSPDDDPDATPDSVRCSRLSATALRCRFGAVAKTTYVGVPLQATSAAKPGTTGTVRMSLVAANGLDTTPADNVLDTTIRFVPQTHLRTKIVTDARDVAIGSDAQVTVTVTNDGDSPVTAFAPVVVENSYDSDSDVGDNKDDATDDAKPRFRITDFSGREGSLDDLGSGGIVIAGATAARPAGTAAALRAMTRTAARTFADGSGSAGSSGSSDSSDSTGGSLGFDRSAFRLWQVGTLQPGQTATAVATVRARRLGRADASAVAAAESGGVSACAASLGAQSGDDSDDSDNADPVTDCPEYDQLTLDAVAKASPDSDAIAATGAPTGPLTGLGLGLLLLGGLSLYAGRRRA